jgi:hypothetical protein
MPNIETITREVGEAGLEIDMRYPGTSPRLARLKVSELAVSIYLGDAPGLSELKATLKILGAVILGGKPEKPKAGLLIAYSGLETREAANYLLEPVSEAGLSKLRLVDARKAPSTLPPPVIRNRLGY